MPVELSEFTIVKTSDKATPKLFSDDASTTKELPYIEYKLKEVFISGVQQNGDGDDAIPDGTSVSEDAFVFDQLAVDPNNPNAEVDGRDFLAWQRGYGTPGPDDNVGVPAVQTDDGLLLPAVQDDGLLLPAVQDDGLLLL